MIDFANLRISRQDLLEAGVHFGHMAKKWNPAMKPYIFMTRNDVHIIDLIKTEKKVEEACKVAYQLAKSGRKILFVGTKKQAQDIVQSMAQEVNMPYVTDRWLGGMLTNFQTVRKSVKKMQSLEKMEMDGTSDLLQKRERLRISRDKEKLERVLRGIAEMNRLPGALFIIDIKREHIAVAEARRLGLPTLGIVDTNSNPNEVDFPIPANDDAAKSIEVITRAIVESIKQGLADQRISQAEAEAMTEGTTEQDGVKVTVVNAESKAAPAEAPQAEAGEAPTQEG